MKHLGDLEKDLQKKLETERKQIENLHKQEFEKLRQNLQTECSNVLNTIKSDTAAIRQKTIDRMKWYSILPMLSITSLSIAFSLGSWGMGRSLARQTIEIQQKQKTLENLKNKTWGVELYQNETGKFLIVPPDSEAGRQTEWICNGKPCLKL